MDLRDPVTYGSGVWRGLRYPDIGPKGKCAHPSLGAMYTRARAKAGKCRSLHTFQGVLTPKGVI